MTDQAPEPYTRVPNALLDNMHRFTPAEFCVLMALARRIIGFNKVCDVVSVSQLMKATRLSNRHVIDCLEALVTKGAVTREPAKRNGFCYQLVNSVHQWTEFTSEDTSPVLVNSVHQSLVNSVHTQKKEKEILKESVATPRKARAPRATQTELEADPVAIYRRVTKVSPNEVQRRHISERATDLEAWRATCEEFAANGWNCRHIGNLLDNYHQRLKAKTAAASRLNGHTPPAAPKRTREEVAAEARELAARAARGEL